MKAASTVFYAPLEPDVKKFRLGIQFENGGNHLKDYSYMSNQVNLFGSPLLTPGPTDGNAGGTIVTTFNGTNAFASVTESDNIRITEISETDVGFSLWYRLKELIVPSQGAVWLMKLDDDSINFAFMVFIDVNLTLYWYVVDNGSIYRAIANNAVDIILQSNFNINNFNPLDFHALIVPPIITTDPTTYKDFVFDYNFSTHNMTIRRNSVDITTSQGLVTTSPLPVPLSINIKQDIITITASAAETGFEATKANDDNLSTLWKKISGFGSWLKADLGAVTVITLVKIAWYLGDQRKYNYVIETSLDNIVWLTVASGASSGLTDDLDIYDFTNLQGRYVRVTVNGNNINNEAGIFELQVFGGVNEGQPEQPPEFADFTKFYEVAAGDETTGIPSYSEVYNVSAVGSTGTEDLGSGTSPKRVRTGEIVVNGSSKLIGKKLTKVIFKMKKHGGPTGTCTARIRKGSDDSLVVSSATLDVSTITTSTLEYEFLFPGNTYSLVAGDKILIEYGGGTPVDYIQVRRLTETDFGGLDPFDGNNTALVSQEGAIPAYVTRNDRDICAKFYTGNLITIDNYESLQFGSTPFSSAIYDVALPGTPNLGPLDNQKKRRGEIAFNSGSDLIGKRPTKITMYLKKVGAPTGTLTAFIYNKDTNTIKGIFGTLDVSTLTTSFVEKTFTNVLLNYPIAVGDLVGAQYLDGDATNYVDVAYTTVNTFDVDSYKALQTGTVWSYNIDQDLCGKLYEGGKPDPNNKLMAGILANATDSILVNKLPTRVLVYLKKAGSPTGTVYIRLRKGSDNTIATEYGTISASLLSTTMTAFEFTNTDATYRVQFNDRLLVEYVPPIGETSASNKVMVKIWNSDEVDGVKTCMITQSGTTYSGSILDQEMSGIIYEGGQLLSDLEEAIPQPPVYSKDLYINAGIKGTDLALAGNIYGYNNCIACEFGLYRLVPTLTQALNYFTNRISISSIAYGHVAQCGYAVFTS